MGKRQSFELRTSNFERLTSNYNWVLFFCSVGGDADDLSGREQLSGSCVASAKARSFGSIGGDADDLRAGSEVGRNVDCGE